MITINTKDYFNTFDETMPTKYKLNVMKNPKDIGYMINYFIKFLRKKADNKFISMDFEFNNCSFKKNNDKEYKLCIENSIGSKEIAIFQILLEDDSIKEVDYQENIFLFYPGDLSEKQTNVLINLLTAPRINKIIHGGESLDIPYIFKMLIKDKNQKVKFCRNLYDTKYICEYNNLLKKTKDKCKIYYFIKEMGIINDNQFNTLLKNEEDMGEIWFINLDIKKLNDKVVLYSSFDVLYLRKLLNESEKRLSKREIDIISGFSSINFIYRSEFSLFSEFMDRISEYNVHMLYDENHGKVTFLDIFDLYFYWVDDKDKIFSKISEINFFKRFINTFFKIGLYNEFTSEELNTNYGKYTSSLKEEDKITLQSINKKKIEFIDFIKNQISDSYESNLNITKFIENIELTIKFDLKKIDK